MTTGRDCPKCHADLRDLAKTLRRKLSTLFTLGDANDPFVADHNFRSKHAYWIAALFERFAIRSRVHVRLVHYKLISQKTPVLQVDGTPYVNSSDCYNRLCDAIRDARYLGLIPAHLIVDRRNPEPSINFDSDEDVSAEIEINHGAVAQSPFGRDYHAPGYYLPKARLAQEPSFGQRYHLEIWIEKSTMNEVLLPLEQEYGINVATFIGEVSATACKNLVDRAIESGRPVRILHVTDFDPAGRDMPISAAVKIDFFARQSGVDLDIRLEHVALTPEQCIQYQLPRTPIKVTETRAAGFEAQYGAGATELDALEALYPGALREILVEHVERYRDDDIDKEVEGAIEEYRDELGQAAALVRSRHAEELAALDRQCDAIRKQFAEVRTAAEAARAAIADPAHAAYDAIVMPAQATYEAIVAAARRDLDAIVNEAQGGLATLVQQADDARDEIIEDARDEIAAMERPVVAEAETLITQINAEFDEVVPDPEQFEWPEPTADEWEKPLYDSTRDYVEQVDIYRAHRGDDEYVGLAADRVITKRCTVCDRSFNTPTARKLYCSSSCAHKAFRKSVRERGGDGIAAQQARQIWPRSSRGAWPVIRWPRRKTETHRNGRWCGEIGDPTPECRADGRPSGGCACGPRVPAK
jgi:hypothetical protein